MKQAPVLTDRDKQRVLLHIARSSYPARNRCMMQLSWLAGMRVGEIAAVNIGDVIGLDGEVRSEIQLKAAQTKGDKARTVLLNSQLRGEISSYVNTLGKPTQARRRAGLRSFPRRPLSGSASQASDRRPPGEAVFSASNSFSRFT